MGPGGPPPDGTLRIGARSFAPSERLVMAIVNRTPDSFYDAGSTWAPDRALARVAEAVAQGADLVDIGGVKAGHGQVVDEAEEIRRVLPVVRALAAAAPVSIDTRNAETMRAALDAGARVVNDISALRYDPAAMGLVAERGAPVVLMHMLGLDAREMQRDPGYEDAALDVAEFLRGRVEEAERAGIPRGRIAVDPGIGFGKTLAHNLDLIDRLALFHGLGVPILLGVSRKSFIGRLSRGEPPKQRLAGSLAAALAGFDRGCQIVRVHDVAETAQARALWQALGG